VKAAEGMEWMQECARGVVVTGNPVEWTVPVTGFRVRQQYIEWRSQRIKTIFAGKMVQPRLNIATTKLDVRKQSNAIAPNVVHSLDAAALMLTVSQAAAQGVEAFAMVHDSYGTLPADCSVLASCCRQSFVRLYTMQDVVWSLYQQFAAQHADPTECPEPPAKGTLDVNAVLASDYFFA
jgi:DNA-directed RNA polymerase